MMFDEALARVSALATELRAAGLEVKLSGGLVLQLGSDQPEPPPVETIPASALWSDGMPEAAPEAEAEPEGEPDAP